MRRVAVVAIVMLAAGAACAVKADGPPRIEVDRTPCAHCGMLISETMFAAAFKAAGAEPKVFDDIGCLLNAAKREADQNSLRFWFHDAATGEWIAGTDATFVRSDQLRTPMNGGFVAYRDSGAAALGAAEHQGHVIANLAALRKLPEKGKS
jgi:copper chaperone NosL